MSAAVVISLERPDSEDAIALITELEAQLDPLYPSESRHGYSVEKLLREGVSFFVIRDGDGVPIGCGGVQFFGTEYGEIKRMYVRPQFRGLGFARLMLDHLSEFTRNNSISVLRLETGIHQLEAIGLYEHAGFYLIPPFGTYQPDPLSRFYEKQIC
ncbi:MAG TPA: GNAT family N-acetyltransferase [Pyrinomonadaceae bacterium]|nr:GNAT family N-acetyltransferase [Pyrinomonadaceae bacterium]